jgi:hypothetical protein
LNPTSLSNDVDANGFFIETAETVDNFVSDNPTIRRFEAPFAI